MSAIRPNKPKVVMTFRLPHEWLGELLEFANVVEWTSDMPPPKEWVIDNAIDADGMLCSLASKIDSDIIDATRKLKVISTYSVGYDHIDVERAKAKGIRIGYTPDVLTDATADLVFALLLTVARRVVEGDRLVRSGGWSGPWRADFMLGSEVHGRTLGIVGMGRIGMAVANRARGFGMKIIYYSRTPKNVDAEYVQLDELLSRSEFVVIAVDLNPDTYHMVDYEFLRRMRRDAYLINASRGKVVSEKDLVRALEEGIIAGAALDVFEEEPIGADHPLTRFRNVVLTPHLGSATYATRREMAKVAIENLIRGLQGKSLLYEIHV